MAKDSIEGEGLWREGSASGLCVWLACGYIQHCDLFLPKVQFDRVEL